MTKVRWVSGTRYPILAGKDRVGTARIVCQTSEDDTLKLDQIKLVDGRDVPLGDQFTFAASSCALLCAIKVEMSTTSLRAALGITSNAMYGIDPSIVFVYKQPPGATHKLGSSISNGKSDWPIFCPFLQILTACDTA